MTDRPTQIECAFALATSGAVSSTREIKEKRRAESYSENGKVQGRTMMKQLAKLIANAKAKSNA
jgi:hypothetical protein